jgi:hypothetical protein
LILKYILGFCKGEDNTSDSKTGLMLPIPMGDDPLFEDAQQGPDPVSIL